MLFDNVRLEARVRVRWGEALEFHPLSRHQISPTYLNDLDLTDNSDQPSAKTHLR